MGSRSVAYAQRQMREGKPSLPLADQILLQLLPGTPLVVEDLVEATGRRRSAVWDAVKQLVEAQDVVETQLSRAKVGRPKFLLAADPDRAGFIGVAIAGRKGGVQVLTGVLTNRSPRS